MAQQNAPSIAQQIVAALRTSGGYWQSHSELDHADWRYQVGNGDTLQGYHDWLQSELESHSWCVSVDPKIAEAFGPHAINMLGLAAAVYSGPEASDGVAIQLAGEGAVFDERWLVPLVAYVGKDGVPGVGPFSLDLASPLIADVDGFDGVAEGEFQAILGGMEVVFCEYRDI